MLFMNTEIEEDSAVYGFEIYAVRAGALVLTVREILDIGLGISSIDERLN